MTEKDEKDSKVIPLFPGKDSGARRGPDPPASASKLGLGDPEVLQEIEGILGEIEPLPPQPANGPVPPPPGHPKAIKCPQCGADTWRETRHCWNCRLDLVEHVEAQIYRRRRRWAIAGRSIIVGSWFVAAGCVYAMNHYYRVLPPKVRGAMFITVLSIVGVNLFLLWMSSEDNRRR